MEKFMFISLSIIISLTTSSVFAQNQPSLETVNITGGSFIMGSDSTKTGNESPAHQVTVAAFKIAVTEITYDQFGEFVAATGYLTSCEQDKKGSFIYNGDDIFLRKKTMTWRKTSFAQSGNSPACSLSWFDAINFANWLSLKDGLQNAYTITGQTVEWHKQANGWRLPTEAEWEYAAGKNSQPSTLDAVAWYWQNSGSSSHPVKQKAANEFGLVDMLGNINEWCWDWYGPYSTKASTNPSGPNAGMFRITRGGGWMTGHWGQEGLEKTARAFFEPQLAYNFNGCRLVRN